MALWPRLLMAQAAVLPYCCCEGHLDAHKCVREQCVMARGMPACSGHCVLEQNEPNACTHAILLSTAVAGSLRSQRLSLQHSAGWWLSGSEDQHRMPCICRCLPYAGPCHTLPARLAHLEAGRVWECGSEEMTLDTSDHCSAPCVLAVSIQERDLGVGLLCLRCSWLGICQLHWTRLTCLSLFPTQRSRQTCQLLQTERPARVRAWGSPAAATRRRLSCRCSPARWWARAASRGCPTWPAARDTARTSRAGTALGGSCACSRCCPAHLAVFSLAAAASKQREACVPGSGDGGTKAARLHTTPSSAAAASAMLR